MSNDTLSEMLENCKGTGKPGPCAKGGSRDLGYGSLKVSKTGAPVVRAPHGQGHSVRVSKTDVDPSPRPGKAATHIQTYEPPKKKSLLHKIKKFFTGNEATDMNRDQKIQFLTMNCSCYKGKEKVLANQDNFTDEDLTRLVTEVQMGHERQTVVNAVRGVVGTDVTINAMPAALADALAKKGKGPKAKKKDMEDDDEDDEEPTGNRQIVDNTELSPEEWFAMAPPGMQNVWNASVRTYEAQRGALAARVQALANNTRNEAKKQMLANLLASNPNVDQLQHALTLADEPQMAANQQGGGGNGFLLPGQLDASMAMPNYGGMGLGAQPVANHLAPSEAAEDIYEMPTLNYEEIARSHSVRRAAQ